jgi:hypothetical protein
MARKKAASRKQYPEEGGFIRHDSWTPFKEDKHGTTWHAVRSTRFLDRAKETANNWKGPSTKTRITKSIFPKSASDPADKYFTVWHN